MAFSGLYNPLFTIGFSNTSEILKATASFEYTCLAPGILAIVHSSYIDSLLYFSFSTRVCLTSGFIYQSLLSTKTNQLVNVLLVKLLSSLYDVSQTRLNYHIAFLFGCLCLLWSGHLIHKALLASRGFENSIFETEARGLLNGNLSILANNSYSDNHVWASTL